MTVVECGKCRSKAVVADCWTGTDVLARIVHEDVCPNRSLGSEVTR